MALCLAADKQRFLLFNYEVFLAILFLKGLISIVCFHSLNVVLELG